MKTKLAPALAVISLSVLLSACGKPSIQTPGQADNKGETKTENFSQKSTLKNLLGMSKNLTCSYVFEDTENKFQVKGTTYISGKKFAQEGETTDPADKTKTIKSYMLSDGDYVYTWSPSQKGTGMKIKIEEPKNEDIETPKTDVAGAKDNMEKEYDMDCKPWVVDQTKFTLPADIKFTDFSEMLKNLPKTPSLPTIPNMPE